MFQVAPTLSLNEGNGDEHDDDDDDDEDDEHRELFSLRCRTAVRDL